MAPEIARCQYKQSPEDRASPATDMFSLGVIAYMLVSGGREPFWDGSDVRCLPYWELQTSHHHIMNSAC